MTSGPWLITTAILVSVRIAVINDHVADLVQVEQIITIVYALALILGAPIDIVISRYSSDCLYKQQPEKIAVPLIRSIAVTLLLFCVVGIVWTSMRQIPIELAIPSICLLVIVGSQWILLSAAGGLSSPGTVIRAFLVGAPISIFGAILLSRQGLGPAGYLYGFGCGQVITLAMLMWGTIRSLPAYEDETAKLLPTLLSYRMLPLAAFAANLGIWVDKLVVYLMGDATLAIGYASLAAMAWFTVVPTVAYVYVQVETSFYRRFRGFYGILRKGARLSDLTRAANAIERDAKRILRKTALVQVTVGFVALVAAPHIVSIIGMDAQSVFTFRVLVVGATFQVIATCSTLLLYYFDLRVEALISASTLLFGNTVLTWALFGSSVIPLGTGYAVASALACGFSTLVLRRRLGSLLCDTFQLQPCS